MARTKLISAKYGRRINLGDYNHVELEAMAWTVVDPEILDDKGNVIQAADDPIAVFADTYAIARDAVRNEAQALLSKIKESRPVPGQGYVPIKAIQYLSEFQAQYSDGSPEHNIANRLMEFFANLPADTTDPDTARMLEALLSEVPTNDSELAKHREEQPSKKELTPAAEKKLAKGKAKMDALLAATPEDPTTPADELVNDELDPDVSENVDKFFGDP